MSVATLGDLLALNCDTETHFLHRLSWISCAKKSNTSTLTVLNAFLLCWVYKVQDEQEGRRHEESHTFYNCPLYFPSYSVSLFLSPSLSHSLSRVAILSKNASPSKTHIKV